MGVVINGVGKGGSIYSYVKNVLCCGGSEGPYSRVRDMVYITTHWEDSGWIQPLGGP